MPCRFGYTLRRRWRRYAIEAIVIIGVFGAIQVWHARGVVQGVAPVLTGPRLDGGQSVFSARGTGPRWFISGPLGATSVPGWTAT